MGYIVEKLDIEIAKKTALNYPFALIYNYGSLELLRTEGLEIDWNQVMEARFFGTDAELHMVFDDEAMAVQVTDDGDGQTLIKKVYLEKKYSALGKVLVMKQYTSRDEDGQTQIVLTRLCGIEQGE